MSDKTIRLILSRPAVMVLHSAANEATIFFTDDRDRVGAPTEHESELLSDSLDSLLDEPRAETHAWVLPAELLRPALRLIPACLEILDAQELGIRTMETPASLAAAQAELERVIEAAGRSR